MMTSLVILILANSLAPEGRKYSNKRNDGVWKMQFDGAQSRTGVGARIVFMSLEGNVISFFIGLSLIA
jgi:hypothetical protein